MSTRDVISVVKQMMAPLKQRVMLTIGRAVILATNDLKNMQLVQISLLADEVKDDVERFQNYGFTSVPKEGAEAVCVFPGGNREHGIVIVVDDRRFRLKLLEDGEVAIYTDEGDKIHLKRGGTIEIIASTKVFVDTKEAEIKASTKAVVNSPVVELGSGTLEKLLNGENFQSKFNAHTHIGNLGGATGPPIQQSVPLDLSQKVKAAV